MNRSVAIIGAGISGISAAAYAASKGHDVTVFEKNSTAGGRARQFTTDNGYVFDMGPSWYWMPDVIENFFNDFGYTSRDFYQLIGLDPQFKMVFKNCAIEIPKDYSELKQLFESIEKGAGEKLDAFMTAAKYKYETGIGEFAQKPCHSWREFIHPAILKSAFRLDLLSNFRKYVSRYFSDPRLISLMEFPVIFLGASPQKIPAMYSLMNYGGYGLGTWYPVGGIYKLVDAMKKIAEQQGARFRFNEVVEKINTKDGKAYSLTINGKEELFDVIIASSDYQHSETLLNNEQRNYKEAYWEKKILAPSCLIYYLGLKEKVPNLLHHTLFFDNDLDRHLYDIYEKKTWPREPLFYVCCPSKTDDTVAPKGHENLFLLMPLATGITDTEELREEYFIKMIVRIERYSGSKSLLDKIDFKRSYCTTNFIHDYNAYKGNAYGLANTLSQTAVFKPAIRNKKTKNLYYTGQFTVPGPGVPPAIISGKIAANQITTVKAAL